MDAIELQVNAKNTAAYEMYRKYGFTEKSINLELLNHKKHGFRVNNSQRGRPMADLPLSFLFL